MAGSGASRTADYRSGTRARLRGVHRCDVAVVGAGLTGLSTAVELLALDPDRRVTVIEAAHVAAGASGRGTGLLGPRIGPPLALARKRYGDDAARAAYLWSVAAVQHVLDLVRRHEIACDLTPGSQLIAAADEKDALRQQREADAADALGLPVKLLPTGSLPGFAQRYLSGLHYAPAATLDPAALTVHLARIGEQRGLTVFEHSPVRRITPGRSITLSGEDGEVVADTVVVAVNAFDAAFAPSGVVGVHVQAGMTGTLPQQTLDELESLRTQPLIECGDLAPYYRLTQDGRLVVGGGAVRRATSAGTASVGAAAALLPERLDAAVRALSPLLADVRVESTWSGPIGMTRDGFPAVGRHAHDPRLYHAGGCNGHGVAASAYHGTTLARWIATGDPGSGPDALLPWIRPRAPWFPKARVTNRALDLYLAHLTAASGRSLVRERRPAARPGRSKGWRPSDRATR